MSVPWRRAADILVSLLLLLNVPFVLIFESQALLPTKFVPRPLQALLKWHVHANGDFFLRRSPPFFLGVIVADIFIRVPLMLLNAYAFYHDRSWGHVTALVYGIHTASIMIPVFFEIYFARVTKRHRLAVAFLPQLIVSLYMILRVLLLNSFLSLDQLVTSIATQALQAIQTTQHTIQARSIRIQQPPQPISLVAAPPQQQAPPTARRQASVARSRRGRQSRRRTQSPAIASPPPQTPAAGAAGTSSQAAAVEVEGTESEAEDAEGTPSRRKTKTRKRRSKRRKSVPRKISLREFIDNAAIVVRGR